MKTEYNYSFEVVRPDPHQLDVTVWDKSGEDEIVKVLTIVIDTDLETNAYRNPSNNDLSKVGFHELVPGRDMVIAFEKGNCNIRIIE